MNPEPTYEDIAAILTENPDTVFVTITKANAAKLNDWALWSRFGSQQPLQVVPTDPEANPDNFEGSKQVAWWPLDMPIHIGAKVILAKNLNKPGDYVNGMQGWIEDVMHGGILVKTKTGKMVMVYPWTDPDTKAVFYPMRIGYANTLHKTQGATLDDITIWLDVPNVEAAAYVAISRVRKDADWRFIGDPSVHHFTPASGF